MMRIPLPFLRTGFLAVCLLTAIVTGVQAETMDSAESAASPATDSMNAPALDAAAASASENPATDFDVRQARWGMTMDDVRGAEPKPPLEAAATSLVYDAPLNDVPCMLLYYFEGGKLVSANYFCSPGSQDAAEDFYHRTGGRIEQQYPGLSDTSAGRMLMGVLLEYGNDLTHVSVINKFKTDGTVVVLYEEAAYHKRIQDELTKKDKR